MDTICGMPCLASRIGALGTTRKRDATLNGRSLRRLRMRSGSCFGSGLLLLSRFKSRQGLGIVQTRFRGSPWAFVCILGQCNSALALWEGKPPYPRCRFRADHGQPFRNPVRVPTIRSERRSEEGVAWGLASTNPFMSPPGLQSRCPSCRLAEAAGPP